MKLLYLLLLLLLCMTAGCQESLISFGQSKIPASSDPNAIREVVKGELQKLTDPTSRFGDMGLVCMILIIGGVIFAVITKTSWGWIIPAAGGLGLGIMVMFQQYKMIIGLSLLALCLTVIIYKAWEYQKERNENGAKNGQ